ncbi:hypothetical protein P9A54_gp66 [Xanthomonas phage vB_Xar_IVIA-DoCa10]|uniref:Uncharacterized protein n=1 Tax=Xanthomonas phage vB_Xar_IVIA-DoCa10 TaxID=2975529 RepID=A0A9X9NZ86_9CAUD|nr:hypothetical protein P9A54_gp66 [Xanthomonas phage vB_Xar_IVIA-DoCa10]UYA99051.1 hypothetical protein IVIADoCa10_66 [Xanthomonas phage vB_Xar_IVIA-DoCa10]
MKCEDHRHELPCPLCALAAWPLRDLNAIADFAGKAVDDTGLVPGERTIRLSQVVQSIGRRWTELERVKLTALRPIYTTKNALVREARIGAIDVGRLEKAALAVAKGATADADPVVDAYVRAIIQEEVDW